MRVEFDQLTADGATRSTVMIGTEFVAGTQGESLGETRQFGHLLFRMLPTTYYEEHTPFPASMAREQDVDLKAEIAAIERQRPALFSAVTKVNFMSGSLKIAQRVFGAAADGSGLFMITPVEGDDLQTTATFLNPIDVFLEINRASKEFIDELKAMSARSKPEQ